MQNKEEIENTENDFTTDTIMESENIEKAAEEEIIELSDLEKTQIELVEIKEKYLRLYSDFDNFRKRTAKEKIDLTQTASASLIIDLLSTVDDYQRAEANASEGEISEGVKLIFSKLINTLQNKGLKEMDAKGQKFDADLHEAITQFPSPTEADKGNVFDVVEKGYFLNDKVIRFAKVVVAN